MCVRVYEANYPPSPLPVPECFLSSNYCPSCRVFSFPLLSFSHLHFPHSPHLLACLSYRLSSDSVHRCWTVLPRFDRYLPPFSFPCISLHSRPSFYVLCPLPLLFIVIPLSSSSWVSAVRLLVFRYHLDICPSQRPPPLLFCASAPRAVFPVFSSSFLLVASKTVKICFPFHFQLLFKFTQFTIAFNLFFCRSIKN